MWGRELSDTAVSGLVVVFNTFGRDMVRHGACFSRCLMRFG